MTAPEKLDITFDDEQQALASSVRAFCTRHIDGDAVRAAAGSFPRAMWKGLGDLGVLALGTPEGGGGALEIAAAMEMLGEANAPGPLTGTFMATQLLDEAAREPVVAGDAVVALGTPPLVPWAAVGDVFVALDGDEAYLAEPLGAVERVETLADEPWGRVTLQRTRPLGDARRATVIGDIAVASYLVGAAAYLVRVTAEWAVDRVQFGQPIGAFQGVAHPLADASVRVEAARILTRLAAYAADNDGDAAAPSAEARLSATRAALDATYRAHQAFGALGFTVEGPVAPIGQRIRQVSLHPPGPNAAREAVLQGHGI